MIDDFTSWDVVEELLASGTGGGGSLRIVRIPTDLTYDSIRKPSAIYKKLTNISRITGLPFWEVAMSASLMNKSDFSALIEEVDRHNRLSEICLLDKSDNVRSRLQKLSRKYGRGGVGFQSTVVDPVAEDRGHIPMLDFHCADNPINRIRALKIMQRLAMPGYLLASGRSFHFIAKAAVSKREFDSFLGRALLFSPYVDRAWIAHQLIEGCCTLRLSAKAGGEVPKVFSRVLLA